MLAALVAEGKLPPVEERIGLDPQVVRPAFEIGQYGGVLQDAAFEFGSGQIIEESQQPMAKWPPDASVFYPNVPKSWELSADEKVFTLHLRRGMKWSDGEDFDAEEEVSKELLDGLRRRYGLDRPMHIQYLKWFGNVLQGELGHSFLLGKPVHEIIGERLALTMLISMCSLAFTYCMAIPIGIYSATHQYRPGDYLFMVLGFIGLATPNFLLAVIFMFFSLEVGLSVGGLFSPEYMRAGWSLGKLLDLVKHLPLPVVIVGTAGTAGLIRIMRGQLLDELERQYVVTARAKGVREGTLLFKYPVRVAINPMISTVGWLLPTIVSGEIIVSLASSGVITWRSSAESSSGCST